MIGKKRKKNKWERMKKYESRGKERKKEKDRNKMWEGHLTESVLRGKREE